MIIVFIGSVAQGFSPAWYFYGLEQIKTMSLYKFLFRLFGFLLLIIFSNSNEDGWIVLASLSLSSILITIFLYIEMIKQTGFIKLSVSNDIRKLFFKSLNSFYITAVPHIYQNLSIVAMSSFVSPLQLGLYFGASRIHRAFNTLFGPLSLAFFPMISSLNEKNKSLTGSMMRKYSLLMFCIGLVFFLINFFFTKQIISLLLGNDYSSAKNILIAFSFVFPLTAISNALGRQWLMVLNKDHVYSFSQIFSSLAAFLFMIIFIKKIGIIAFPFSLIFFESLSILIIIIYMIKIKI